MPGDLHAAAPTPSAFDPDRDPGPSALPAWIARVPARAAVARGLRRTRRNRPARDAVAPTMDLAPRVRGSRAPMSPRATARLCDRLARLGVVREPTGRATLRPYGL